MKLKSTMQKICKNCQCRRGRHYPRIGGLVCPAYKNSNEPKYFEEELTEANSNG